MNAPQLSESNHVRDLGPYLALALVMPGGSVLALLLWWQRHDNEDQRHVLIRNGKDSRMNAQFKRVAAALTAAVAVAGCASMDGLSTRASINEPSTLAVNRSLDGTAVSPAAWPRARLVEAFSDPQLDRSDGRSARGQPDAARGRGARAQGARVRARRRGRRSVPQGRRRCRAHAPALSRARPDPAAIRRRVGQRRLSSRQRSTTNSICGARTARRTTARWARRKPRRSTRLPRASRCRSTSRTRTCSCSAPTCSSTSPRRRSTSASRSTSSRRSASTPASTRASS